MNEKPKQILAALKKLGPSSPTAIGDSVGMEPSAVGYHLRTRLQKGELKAQGTSNNRRYALPEQKFSADTPPQKGKPAARKPAAAAKPRPAGDFIAAITFDHRAVLIEDGTVRVFSPERTQAIADLMLNHFEA
jgi:DNA-binding Lrp family transcriptional regulator